MSDYTHSTDPAEVRQGDALVAAFTDPEAGPFAGACAQALARTLSERGPDLLDGLPETCYAAHLSDGSLTLLKRGERGYWPTEGYPLGQFPNYSVYADYLNARRGVTPAQRAAMEAGSMFGFDIPGADPAKYGPDGRFKR